ncbi:MAG TPA: GWxTD domain-containing protein [Candidatus Kryptonia bacterium]
MTKRNSTPGKLLQLALCGILAAGCSSQKETVQPAMMTALLPPRFGFFISDHPSALPDSSVVDLYARVRYDDIIFVRSDSEFAAHYQLSINAYADKEMTVDRFSKFFDRRITVKSYPETISASLFDTLGSEVQLSPGTYYMELRLYDLNTNETSSREFIHTFKDYSRSQISISDLLLYDQADTSGNPIEVATNRFDTLYAKFFVVCKRVPADVGLHIVARSTQIPTSIDTTYRFNQDTSLRRYSLPLIITDLAPATYDFEITAVANGEESSSRTLLRVPRSNVPLVPSEMDEAIGPLEYIANGDIIASLRKGPFSERQRKFKQFWLARAHGDQVTADALMREFYRRVDYANTHFTASIGRGWQSDRGRIYIIYGPPDDVQTQENGFNSPAYLYWYYYNSQIEFIFLDQFGTGDYRLIRSTNM